VGGSVPFRLYLHVTKNKNIGWGSCAAQISAECSPVMGLILWAA